MEEPILNKLGAGGQIGSVNFPIFHFVGSKLAKNVPDRNKGRFRGSPPGPGSVDRIVAIAIAAAAVVSVRPPTVKGDSCYTWPAIVGLHGCGRTRMCVGVSAVRVWA